MTSEELTAWRERTGYSQLALAEALGVSNVSVSRWEHGTREIPSFLHLALRCLELERGERNGKGKTKKKMRKEVRHERKHPEKR